MGESVVMMIGILSPELDRYMLELLLTLGAAIGVVAVGIGVIILWATVLRKLRKQ